MADFPMIKSTTFFSEPYVQMQDRISLTRRTNRRRDFGQKKRMVAVWDWRKQGPASVALSRGSERDRHRHTPWDQRRIGECQHRRKSHLLSR